MTSLDQSIVLFAHAHAAELDPVEVYLLARAAAIVLRVHTSPAYLSDEALAALRDGLRDHPLPHPPP